MAEEDSAAVAAQALVSGVEAAASVAAVAGKPVAAALEVAERSRQNEAAIRGEILTGAVRQSWMDKMFTAAGLT